MALLLRWLRSFCKEPRRVVILTDNTHAHAWITGQRSPDALDIWNWPLFQCTSRLAENMVLLGWRLTFRWVPRKQGRYIQAADWWSKQAVKRPRVQFKVAALEAALRKAHHLFVTNERVRPVPRRVVRVRSQYHWGEIVTSEESDSGSASEEERWS